MSKTHTHTRKHYYYMKANILLVLFTFNIQTIANKIDSHMIIFTKTCIYCTLLHQISVIISNIWSRECLVCVLNVEEH